MSTLVSNGKMSQMTGNDAWRGLLSRLADWFEYVNAARSVRPGLTASEFAKSWEAAKRRFRYGSR